MAQGKALTDWQIVQIRATWLLTENGSEAARAAGCAQSTANAYIKANLPDLRQLRHEKTPDLADALGAAANRLVSALFDGARINGASLSQVATALGIVIDKRQLLTGQATARTETGAFDPGRLSPPQREELADLIDLATHRGAA